MESVLSVSAIGRPTGGDQLTDYIDMNIVNDVT